MMVNEKETSELTYESQLDEGFLNPNSTIDTYNKIKPVPTPDKVAGIDTTNYFLDQVIEADKENKLDTASINSLTSVSRSRETLYDMLDTMAQDSMIAAILGIYCADACEMNSQGQIVWCEAEDAEVKAVVDYMLDSINVDKHAYGWVYSLMKYGDLYLRLYRESDYYGTDIFKAAPQQALNEATSKQRIDEALRLKYYSKNDRYAEYVASARNPSEMFDLQRFGKTAGYIKANITHRDFNVNNPVASTNYLYNFKSNDIEIYGATEFVHAILEDTSSRGVEEVSIFTDLGDGKQTVSKYEVRRGKSILYDSYKIWRELSLLENAVLLNRLTKSALVRTISVDVTDMSKDDIPKMLGRVKQMVEQKSALSLNNSLVEYTNPGAMDNIIYIPVHDGKGAISVGSIGGDGGVNLGDLVDLDYWRSKLAGAFAIPKQFIGDTNDSGGFDGGTSLSLLSSRYAKSVKRIQNAFIQGITDAINLMLYDRGLKSYINKFTIRMQAPATKEEKDRRETLQTDISNIESIMNMVKEYIEAPAAQIRVLKSLLSNANVSTDVLGALQAEADRLEAEAEEKQIEEGAAQAADDAVDEFNDAEPVVEPEMPEPAPEPDDNLDDYNFDMDSDVESTDEAPVNDEEDLPSFEAISAEQEEFQHNENAELLMETDDSDLPSFEEQKINFNEVDID